jgi:cytochrome c peroxidase
VTFEFSRAARLAGIVSFGAAAALTGFLALNRLSVAPFTGRERELVLSLWLANLPAPPEDRSNRFRDDERAARLGARIFKDPRFSANGKVSCATCHQPERAYSDGLKVASGLGQSRRNTPSIAAAAYGAWFFWDGRRDSQWAQALTPLESEAEHGGTRTAFVHVIARHYRGPYEDLFGRMPALSPERMPPHASPLGDASAREAWRRMSEADRDAANRVFANIGKSLAAYQRRLKFRPSRFDRFAEELSNENHWLASRQLSSEELEGLRLFIGRARCTDCHRGPLFTSFEFFSLALPVDGRSTPDPGRAAAFSEVQHDPFNCSGAYSDANGAADCTELRFMSTDKLGFLANFKTPSLRNVALTAPYMHGGEFERLQQVVDHYDQAPLVPFPEHTDLRPIGLSESEKKSLVAFLSSLSSEIDDPFADERP